MLIVGIIATNPDSQAGTLTDAFTYIPPPTIKAISPSRYFVSGGIEVAIIGDNFQDDATVKIGDNAASDVVVVSETQITAKVPAGSGGTVEVAVTNPDSQLGTLPDGFAYIPPPTVTAISPPSGTTSGGTEITITGVNFVYGATVTIGGNIATDVVVFSSTEIIAKTPGRTLGAVDVIVTNPYNQTDTFEDGFTYIPPPGDVASKNGEGIPDGYVDVFDLYTMGRHWHESGSGIVADIASKDGEGIADEYVDTFDLYTMGKNWHEGTPLGGDITTTTITPEKITSNDGAILAVDFVYEDNSGADAIENTTHIDERSESAKLLFIVAQNVVNLATYNVVINFDPSILTYVETDSGPGLSLTNILESEGGKMLGLMVDEEHKANGKLELTNTLVGTGNAPSGNGLLGVIKFTVQSDNETQISFGTSATDNHLISIKGISDTSFISNGQLLNGGVNQTVWGDVSGDNHVTAYDAALILQQTVGLIQFTEQQEEIADVSGTEDITAYDAALIMQYVVGIINQFPVQSGDNVQELNTRTTANTTAQRYRVQIGDASAKAGEMINVPINLFSRVLPYENESDFTIDSATDIIAGNITIEYDASLLKPVSVSRTGLTAEYLLEYSIPLEANKGQLSAAFAGQKPLVGSGNLVMLAFEVLSVGEAAETSRQNTRLTLTKIRLNGRESRGNFPFKAEAREGYIEIIPSQTAFLQNYPNPFNPETWIPFQLAEDSEVSVRIFNLDGTLIRTLQLGHKPAGYYINRNKAAYWDGENSAGEKASSGLYFYTIQAGKLVATKKMILVK